MDRVVGVRFKFGNKVYTFNAGSLELSVGDTVIVDSEQGTGAAVVATEVREEERRPDEKPFKNILRKATQDDKDRMAQCREKEDEAFRVCQKKISERDMIMKLVRVEWALDNSKATFYFTADGRVDFRDLVRDLAHRFKIRIEMRQIGVRDEAKMLGGFGPCGRELCCSSFLKDFEPVSIKMAKKQDLVLNPAKISGTCGRLMCCLGYEYSFYDEIKKSEKKMKEKKLADQKAAAAGEVPAMPEQPAEQPAGEKPAEKPKKKRRAWRKKSVKAKAGEGGQQLQQGQDKQQPSEPKKPREPRPDRPGGQAVQPGQEQPKPGGRSGRGGRGRRGRGGRGGGGGNRPGGGAGGPKPGGAPQGGGD